jgi:hypothetical protein
MGNWMRRIRLQWRSFSPETAELAAKVIIDRQIPPGCEWSCLLGIYLGCRITSDQRAQIEAHLLQCEWCACELEICLLVLTQRCLPGPSLFYRMRQWLLRS